MTTKTLNLEKIQTELLGNLDFKSQLVERLLTQQQVLGSNPKQ